MALDERAAAAPDGRSREDEIAALTAQLRGMLLRGFGTLTMILVAVLGFFGNRLWTTVDRHTEQLAALSTSVAALGERLDLDLAALRERMDLNVAALRERMDLQFATLTKDVERTRSEIERTRSEILQALAGAKRPAVR